MTALLAFLLLLAGFAVLALSLPKHHRDLLGKALPRRREMAMRVTGWTLLMLAFVPATAAQGVSVGIALWFGLATFAALIVALSLTYRHFWWRG